MYKLICHVKCIHILILNIIFIYIYVYTSMPPVESAAGRPCAALCVIP